MNERTHSRWIRARQQTTLFRKADFVAAALLGLVAFVTVDAGGSAKSSRRLLRYVLSNLLRAFSRHQMLSSSSDVKPGTASSTTSLGAPEALAVEPDLTMERVRDPTNSRSASAGETELSAMKALNVPM